MAFMQSRTFSTLSESTDDVVMWRCWNDHLCGRHDEI